MEIFGFMVGDICGSFSNFQRLATLRLAGLKNRWTKKMYLVDIGKLPMTLKMFKFMACENVYISPANEVNVQSLQLPTLEKISFEFAGEHLPSSGEKVLWVITYSRTTSIQVEGCEKVLEDLVILGLGCRTLPNRRILLLKI